ncbi:MAG: guanosine monophosphate reductase [Candidatus Paceibacterota bacterium]|jgi:IMP dehydrogenase
MIMTTVNEYYSDPKFPGITSESRVLLGALDFKDVYLIPQYTEVTSRSQVSTAIELGGIKLDIPVISANMDTVTESLMASEMRAGGAIGAIHRFMSIERNVEIFKETSARCFVSVGVNDESRLRADALHHAGARYFIVDIAHGHSKMMKDMIMWLRATYEDIFIMGGNVATTAGVLDLVDWGCDAVKVGIGPGAVCTTKNVTGVTIPQLSAVLDCASALTDYRIRRRSEKQIYLVADGGITEIGDIAKCLAAGADLVMSGRLFASATEAPGARVHGQKVYRGMASRDAMLTVREEKSLPTAEGITTLLDEPERSVELILKDIKGGLQSSFSYSNARNLVEFREKAVFGIRRTSMK